MPSAMARTDWMSTPRQLRHGTHKRRRRAMPRPRSRLAGCMPPAPEFGTTRSRTRDGTIRLPRVACRRLEHPPRSEEGRVGEECVSTESYRWSPYPKKKKEREKVNSILE